MAAPGEEVAQVSVTDLDLLTEASRDVDAVVHLAGIPGETVRDPHPQAHDSVLKVLSEVR